MRRHHGGAVLPSEGLRQRIEACLLRLSFAIDCLRDLWRRSRRFYSGRDPLEGGHGQAACFTVRLALRFEQIA